jgi:hypothetical protein
MQLPSLFGEYSHVSPNFRHGRGGDFRPSLEEAAGPAVYVPGNSPFGEFRTTQAIPNATPTAPNPKIKRRLLFARAISRRVSSPSGFCLSSCTLPGWSVPQHVSRTGCILWQEDCCRWLDSRASPRSPAHSRKLPQDLGSGAARRGVQVPPRALTNGRARRVPRADTSASPRVSVASPSSCTKTIRKARFAILTSARR